MKDTIIINTISKIHSAIISFLSFVIFTLIFVFIVLQNGLYLEDVSISNINIKKLYIKWDQKLNLYVDQLQISPTTEQKTDFSTHELTYYTKNFYHLITLFDSIVISHLHYNEFKGEIQYKSDKKLQLKLDSAKTHIDTALSFNEKLTNIEIKKFQSNNVTANGNIYLDMFTLDTYSKIDLHINNDANLTLYTSANTSKLKYKLFSHNQIQDVKKIIRQVPLPKEVHYWVFDAIELENFEIYTLNGFIEFNDLKNAYKKLHVTASANKLNYTYNPKLDAVHTDHTDLEFKEGVLYIRPKEALSYSFDMQESWLKIDFTKQEELLTLFLKFSPQLDDDILNVLKTYKISLPMKQNSGEGVDTNLTLAVGLKTIDVDAQGTFYNKKGNFHYLGQDIDIQNLKLSLNNYDIKVKDMSASYKNMINAKVDINYNAKEAQGDVKLRITKAQLQKQLKLAKKPLLATYYIDPKQDILSIEGSSWLYNNTPIKIDKIDMPLDLNSFQLHIPTSYFSIKDISDGFFSGDIDLKKVIANLEFDILNFQYNGIKSTQSNTPLKLQYKDSVLTLNALDDIFLQAVSSELKLSKLSLKLEDQNLYIQSPLLTFGKFTQARVNTKYDLSTNKAHFSLNDLIIRNPKNNKIIYKNKKVLLNASIEDDKIRIASTELRSTFNLDSKQWSLKLHSLENLYRQSDLMQKYHLTDGKVNIYKKSNEEITRFKAELNYPYKLLYENNKPVDLYKIEGKLTTKQNVYIQVNKTIDIAVEDNVDINIHDSNISLPHTIEFLSSIDSNDSNSSKGAANVNITASNSNIYLGDNRYAISDDLKIQYHDHILTAQLQHLNGKAGFKLENNQFHLYGEGFNDKFMDRLFTFSKFKDGTFDFNVHGSLDKYSGVFLIEKSTLLDYVLLNNVLAFINTVPSLITFSVPGYSKNGLYMNHTYLKFDYNKGIYDINEMYMDSKELKISANGKVNLKNDSVDMEMNLQTDLASDVSKIPLVGYIIFDGKAISTSVKITGKLSDPKINSALAKEVIVAPLNIIKRTLKLPFKIFE
ncbi:AsmA-like C-terminal domain-containing protein [Sulfurimonas marina]|uniref:DUF3971 domain-containing protein n=1 Tax=Sulfurimonas marina TaxID=2590551 RepID=A0A7M1AV44_9BACT|nr:AsmA-like C-terminal domain-containing protein [Sulfurimonas marina]QOP41311.1 DUF3971 domain-containing protein [Sulfurimonas marina]